MRTTANRLDPPEGFELRLEYAPTADLTARYGHGRPQHSRLEAILARGIERYRDTLEQLVQYEQDLVRLPRHGVDSSEPCWINEWLIGLDTVSLYGFLRSRRPARYVEIGSGQSTKVVARACRDGGFDTKIISIDPSPRAEVDGLCDVVHRSPLEAMDIEQAFGGLSAGDVVFFDGSHRVLPNSDCVAFFMDVLPALPEGVLVGIHDVYLPSDYPPGFIELWWSEQYALASYLLADSARLRVALPCYYVSGRPELAAILDPLWTHPGFDEINPRGTAFWLEITRSP